MEIENQDQNLNGNGNQADVTTQPPNPQGTAGDGTPNQPETVQIPKEQWQNSQSEGIRLNKILKDNGIDPKTGKKAEAQETPQVTGDEKRFNELAEKRDKTLKEQEKEAEAQLRKDMEEMHTIYGDFNETELQKVVDRYGCYDQEDNVNWHAAMELYNKFGGKVPEAKPATPQSNRQGATPQQEVETPVDVSKMSLEEVKEAGLKKFGL